jgi:formylmethanofuran dehydrogenase subunit E
MVHSSCTYRDIFPGYTPDQLAAFHGHLGPFLVLGYRMGRYARRELSGNPFEMHAIVYLPEGSPEICIADGIQLGSGCTLGKGNIEIIPDPDMRCEFICGERRMLLRYRPFPRPARDGQYEQNLHTLAHEFYASPDEEIFSVVLEPIDQPVANDPQILRK